MTLAGNISALASRISTEFKSVRTALAGKANTSHTHPSLVITDWNAATETGFYASSNTALNAPVANWLVGEVVNSSATNYVTQTVWPYLSGTSSSDTGAWRRQCIAGTWGAWYRIRISQEELDARYQQMISAGTISQYWRGDKTWQTLNNTAVGLGNVPNINPTNASNLSSGTVPDARLPSRLSDGSLQAKYLAAVQTGAPAGPTIGQQWWDSNNYALKVWDGTTWIRTGLPAGALAMMHKNVLPPGWLTCDGATVPAKYTDLIDYLGGTVTPNTNDRTLRISGPSDLNPAPGEYGGADSTVLSNAQMPSHTHNMDHDHPNTTFDVNYVDNTTQGGTGRRVNAVAGVGGSGGTVGTAALNVLTRFKDTGNAGSSSPVDMTNRYYGIKLIIKT